MRRVLARAALVLLAMVTVGCATSDATSNDDDRNNDDDRTTMTTNGDRARDLALESAHRTLRELELDAGNADVEGSTRVTVCTDTMGQATDERFGEYSSGSAIGDDALTDEQIDALETRLAVTFLEDSTDAVGTRLVSFVLPVDGEDVVVRLSRTTDGAGTLTTSTPCLG